MSVHNTAKNRLFKVMERFKIRKNLRILVEDILKNIRIKVKTSIGIKHPFNTASCLRQGDALCCMLLNISLEEALRKTNVGVGKAMFRTSVQTFG
jgi:hypothetical protein